MISISAGIIIFILGLIIGALIYSVVIGKVLEDENITRQNAIKMIMEKSDETE